MSGKHSFNTHICSSLLKELKNVCQNTLHLANKTTQRYNLIVSNLVNNCCKYFFISYNKNKNHESFNAFHITYVHNCKKSDCFTYLSHNYSFQFSFLRAVPTKYCCTSFNPNQTSRLCHVTALTTRTSAIVFILHVPRSLHDSQLLPHIY